MESIEAAARDYRETLAELRNNNKTQINLLTILADDFKEAASQIVDVIEMHLNTCSPSQKLPVLYVCDSILKNVGKPNEYDTLFSRKIINMFEHVFRQGDERTRAALYKLRVTWASTGLFMPSKLYALDMKINKLDAAWPISNPNTGRALRHDPQVMVTPTPPTRAAPVTSNGSNVSAAPASNTGASSTSSSRVFVNPRFIESSGSGSTIQSTKKSQEKTKTSSSAAVKEKPIKKDPKEPRQDPLDKLLPSTSTGPGKSSASSTSVSKRKSIPSEHPNAPIRKKQAQPALDEDLREINLSNKKNAQQPVQDQDFRPKTLRPTSVIGSHAFVPAAVVPPPRPAAPPVQQLPFIPLPPNPIPVAPFHHNSQAQPPVQTALHNGMGGPYNHNSPPQDPAPKAAMAPVPPPPVQMAPPQQQKNVYASEQPKLDVPANNRIFVDGKAYEVMFVDDTAVIERAGAPHRIYFAGPPRNLIIDGTVHSLPFDQATEIEILGSKHSVKFGAPSRELYIGGHPFKGQFGGPPIIATINGRRHEIRLTGSAPEVRIEPEPAYHLTHFLHKMREEKKIEIASEKPEKKEDWLSYLKNLQKSGILPPVKTNSSPRHQTPPPMNPSTSSHGPNGGHRGGRQNHRQPQTRWGGAAKAPLVSPIDSTPAGNGVEKRGVPPAAITDFNIRVLQVRYDSVVDALTTKRLDSCKYCGMRLDNSQGKSKEWQDHMDWHVKQNLARHGTNSSAAAIPYRQWYPSASAWLTPRASEQPSDQEADKQGSPLPGVDSTGVKTKECSVCGEKFDEYYDDDEETWRLRDTVNVHGKVVHAACASDATHSMDSTIFLNDSEIKKEEPFDMDDA